MNAVRHVGALAGFELRGAVRSRWVLVSGLVIVLASVGATMAGLRSFASLGLAGAGAATDGVVHVTLLLPPLVGLLLGAGTIARDRERGMLSVVAAQPVGRWLLPLSSFGGCVVALWVVIAFGIGAGTLLVSTVATTADVVALVRVLLVCLAAAACSVALGVLVSAVARTHQQAVAVAATLWLLLALGLDMLLAGVAPGLRLGRNGLLAVVLVNPLEAARVLGLLVLDGTSNVGSFGTHLEAMLGRSGAIRLLVGVLAWWTLVPLAVASWVTHRRDA